MKKSVKRIAVGTGLFVAGITSLVVASYVFTKKMVRVALDRELPKSSEKSKKKISRSIFNEEFTNRIEKDAKNLEESGCEVIIIKGHDGEKLVGHLFRNENAERTIIAMHGWRSSWNKDFGIMSNFWHENNCNVLYVEQRGQNNSGGKYMGFGMVERFDCLEWARWAETNISEKSSIYLAGVSMGATTVLMASNLQLPKNVCGIIADCAYTSPHDIWKHVTEKNLHLSYGIMGSIANEMCKRKIHLGTKDFSAVDALKETNIPVLFIHGTSDKFVPIEMTYENYLACNSEKEILIVPGAEHGRSYLVDREKYEKTMMDFWKKYDFGHEQRKA